jgi:hypothetical protein
MDKISLYSMKNVDVIELSSGDDASIDEAAAAARERTSARKRAAARECAAARKITRRGN